MKGEVKMNRVESKEQAKKSLEGNWSKAVLFIIIIVVISAIVGVVSLVPVVGWVVATVVTSIMAFGQTLFFLNLSRNKEAEYSDLYKNAKSHWITMILTVIIMSVLIFLWTLCLVIPGIIAALRYSMTFYIMNDHPELKPLEAITKSKEMMRGHKWDLFVLYLSFLGWAFLCIFTFGIGYLFLAPYMETTVANFYQKISA